MANNQKIRKGKRRWYSIHAPTLYEKQLLGETFIWETESLIGKPLRVNMMTLTNNPKKQSMEAFFVVNKVEEGVGYSKAVGLEMMQNASRRLARRGRSKVSDSFLAKTNDGSLIRIKPIIMTRSKAAKATQSALRAKAKEVLRAFTAQYSFETLMNEIVQNRLQRYLKDQLSAVFPVRSADIRSLRYAKFDISVQEAPIEEVAYELRKKMVKAEASEAMSSLTDELEAALLDDEDEDDFDDEDDEVLVSEEEIVIDDDSEDEDISDESEEKKE